MGDDEEISEGLSEGASLGVAELLGGMLGVIVGEAVPVGTAVGEALGRLVLLRMVGLAEVEREGADRLAEGDVDGDIEGI